MRLITCLLTVVVLVARTAKADDATAGDAVLARERQALGACKLSFDAIDSLGKRADDLNFDDYHKSLDEIARVHDGIDANIDALLRNTTVYKLLQDCVKDFKQLDQVWQHSLTSSTLARDATLPARVKDTLRNAAADEETLRAMLLKRIRSHIDIVRVYKGI